MRNCAFEQETASGRVLAELVNRRAAAMLLKTCHQAAHHPISNPHTLPCRCWQHNRLITQ